MRQDITDRDRMAALRHARGISPDADGKDRPWRNYVLAEGRAQEICEALVGEGLMEVAHDVSMNGRGVGFKVTDAGNARLGISADGRPSVEVARTPRRMRQDPFEARGVFGQLLDYRQGARADTAARRDTEAPSL